MQDKIQKHKNIALKSILKYKDYWHKKGIRVTDLIRIAEKNLNCDFRFWCWQDWNRFSSSVRKHKHLKGWDVLYGIYDNKEFH